MKVHTTRCARCEAVMICDRPECSEADHVCYSCISATRVIAKVKEMEARSH